MFTISTLVVDDSGAEGVGDEGFAVEVVGGVEGFVAGGFEGGDGGVEFAGGDLFGGGVDVAEFAGGEVVRRLGAHGWAEGAAEDGAVFVEVAGAGGGVEDGAGFVVGELFEEDGGFVVFGEDAGGEVAGEPGVEAGEGFGYAGLDACARWGRFVEGSRPSRRRAASSWAMGKTPMQHWEQPGRQTR